MYLIFPYFSRVLRSRDLVALDGFTYCSNNAVSLEVGACQGRIESSPIRGRRSSESFDRPKKNPTFVGFLVSALSQIWQEKANLQGPFAGGCSCVDPRDATVRI